MRFHFGWNEIFLFPCLVIFLYNCLHDTTRNETHCGCYSLQSFWWKWNFISGNKISCKNYPTSNPLNGKICACVYFIKTKKIGFYWMGRFFRLPPEMKLHFILPAMKSKVNRIYFLVSWNFILGRFHFGSHPTHVCTL